MLVFPNCKINLGLYVTEKRTDGFHNIETVFYPAGWRDGLEVLEGGSEPFHIVNSGLAVDGPQESNILYKAWKLIAGKKNLPNLKVYLHKNIPMGAGLGGGSSDAAFFLKLLNKKFELGFTTEELKVMASSLGSDCAFFVENKPVLGTGKGDVFEPVKLDLSGCYLLIVHPGVHSNTKEAYEGVHPKKPLRPLKDIIENEHLINWKDCLVNDFEVSIFKKYPQVKELKAQLYAAGALYACMSGSGSAVFGIFNKKPQITFPENYKWHLTEPL